MNPRKVPPDPSDPATWYTRGEVAKLIGVSSTSVINLEGRRLHPVVDERGYHRFNPNEVHALETKAKARTRTRNPTPGEIEAGVLTLLAEGCTKIECCTRLHVPMREVQRIWEESRRSFEDATEERKKAEVRARHEARQAHAAELAMRERIERLKVERQRLIADGEVAKQIKTALRSIGIKPERKQRTDVESPTEDAAASSGNDAARGED
jgi:hypothetical protein